MATQVTRGGTDLGRTERRGVASRLVTETKTALKTTEFWAMAVVIVGILISAAVIKGGDSGGTDEFIARHAWLYVSIVAAGYMISRGLAKSGTADPYWAERGDRDADH
jgi:uncharacterized membrane protein YcjF (UPF0283 family)